MSRQHSDRKQTGSRVAGNQPTSQVRSVFLSVTTTLLSVSVIAVGITGCNREPQSWTKAAGMNTPAAYDEYLKKHPDGAHAREASAALERIRDEAEWTESKAANTPEAYDRYLQRRPEGRYVVEARTARADAAWSADMKLLASGDVAVSRSDVPDFPRALMGVVLEFHPSGNLTFELSAENTYVVDKAGRKTPWSLFQPIAHKGGRLLVGGHDLGGIPRPYGGTIMRQLECEKHTIAYHAGFISRIGSYADQGRDWFQYPAIKPTSPSEQLLPLTVEIPQGSTRTMAVLFGTKLDAGVAGIYVAGHRLAAAN